MSKAGRRIIFVINDADDDHNARPSTIVNTFDVYDSRSIGMSRLFKFKGVGGWVGDGDCGTDYGRNCVRKYFDKKPERIAGRRRKNVILRAIRSAWPVLGSRSFIEFLLITRIIQS